MKRLSVLLLLALAVIAALPLFAADVSPGYAVYVKKDAGAWSGEISFTAGAEAADFNTCGCAVGPQPTIPARGVAIATSAELSLPGRPPIGVLRALTKARVSSTVAYDDGDHASYFAVPLLTYALQDDFADVAYSDALRNTAGVVATVNVFNLAKESVKVLVDVLNANGEMVDIEIFETGTDGAVRQYHVEREFDVGSLRATCIGCTSKDATVLGFFARGPADGGQVEVQPFRGAS